MLDAQTGLAHKAFSNEKDNKINGFVKKMGREKSDEKLLTSGSYYEKVINL